MSNFCQITISCCIFTTIAKWLHNFFYLFYNRFLTMQQDITLALDWTANTNHTGFYVAQELGFYKEQGLDVDIMTPYADSYNITPAKKVELGIADFALCPMESLVSYRTKATPYPLIAVAAILQEDLSAIVALSESNIASPKDLDEKVYASYKARYEDEIVRQMIRSSGGEGNIELIYPDKLGIWNVLLDKKADATWIFMNWEGLQAQKEGISLNTFRLSNYKIPYGYSPVLVTGDDMLNKNKAAYKKFVAATKKGFIYAQKHPQEAADILQPHVSKDERSIDLLKSQIFTSKYYGEENQWGFMDKGKVDVYIDWIYKNKLETVHVSSQELYTNELLD